VVRGASGFTLVELLVVIGIILIVAAMTLSAVNLTVSGDRIRGAARQVQSYLEGARSRAVYGGNVKADGLNYQCGVRLIPDANNPALITSMIYVESQPNETQGVISIGRRDGGQDYSSNPPDGYADAPDVRVLRGYGTRWVSFYNAGLISNGLRIKIPNDIFGKYYKINASELGVYPGFGPEILLLTSDYQTTSIPFQLGSGMYMPSEGADGVRGTTANDDNLGMVNDPYEWQWPGSDDLTDVLAFNNTFTYSLELAPAPMPNQEPRLLGRGVVLDTTLSKGVNYLIATPQRMDIMFSPRGTVAGPLAASGIISLVVSDIEDSLKNISLTDVSNKRERFIVSMTPQTGKTNVHPVYIGTPSDPYRYSETGEVAR